MSKRGSVKRDDDDEGSGHNNHGSPAVRDTLGESAHPTHHNGVIMTTAPAKSGLFEYFKAKRTEGEAEPKNCSEFIHETVTYIKDESVNCFKSVQYELTPPASARNITSQDIITFGKKNIFVPGLPAFYNPGWLTNYAVGIVTPEKQWATLESFWDDMWAGITVSLVLIPQGLSYGILANLPAIRGLYAAVLPSSVYTFFGSSMQLAVGPVAIVSLLVGKVITQYNLAPLKSDTAEEAAMRVVDAGNLAAQMMFCCGIILTVMSILNLGSLIRFVSQPVFSGFTTGAAMNIGLSQMKNAFGFTTQVPQLGDANTHYNYEIMQWYIANWNGVYTSSTKPKSKSPFDEGIGKTYRNPYAEKIFAGVFVPLFISALIKSYWKPVGERKKAWQFRLFSFIANILPVIAMCIAGNVAYNIQTNNPTDYYARQIKCIGVLNSGIYDLIRIPDFRFPWGELFINVIPLTLIAFMESYSVARKIAVERNELHILSGNQELWAVGIANMVGSVGSSYVVAGSFSRSALNAASGARTPMSKAVCMLVIVLVISTMTETLTYVPTAANSAVIWAALLGLIDFTDLWYTFKLSKSDFLVQLVALAITFILDTERGLACSLGLSIIFLLYNISFSPLTAPFISVNVGKAVVIRLNNDLSFFSVSRIKDFLAFEVMLNRDTIPEKITLDFVDVKHIDKTALMAFKEIFYQAANQDIMVDVINISDGVLASFDKAGLQKAVFVADTEKGTYAASENSSKGEKFSTV